MRSVMRKMIKTQNAIPTWVLEHIAYQAVRGPLSVAMGYYAHPRV